MTLSRKRTGAAEGPGQSVRSQVLRSSDRSGKPLTDLKIVVQVPGGPQHPHGGINKKQDEALIDCVSR